MFSHLVRYNYNFFQQSPSLKDDMNQNNKKIPESIILSKNQQNSIEQLQKITKKHVLLGFQNIPLKNSLLIDDSTLLHKIFNKSFKIFAKENTLSYFNPDRFDDDYLNRFDVSNFSKTNEFKLDYKDKSFIELTSFINDIQAFSEFVDVKNHYLKIINNLNTTENTLFDELLSRKERELSVKKFVDKILNSLNNQLPSVIYLDWDYHCNTPFNGGDVAKELKRIDSTVFIVLITSSSFDNLLSRLSLSYVDGFLITQKNVNDFNVSNNDLNKYLNDFLKTHSTPHSTPEILTHKEYSLKSSEQRKQAIVPIQNFTSSHQSSEDNLNKLIPLKQSCTTRYFLNPFSRLISSINCISSSSVQDLNIT